MKLDPSILGSKAPIDPGFLFIALILPSGHLLFQKVSELSIQTLILNNNENILNKSNERIRFSAEKMEWNSQ
jgi:hypothetical protein